MNYTDLFAMDSGPAKKRVPNQFPQMEFANQRLAIIGEAPGKDEEELGKPFVGASGYALDKALSSAKIARSGAFIGNICQVRPPGNKIEKFLWEGAEIQSGLEQLKADLDLFKPNLCLLLGNFALKATYESKYKIEQMRGSLFRCSDPRSPMFGYKCLATYHPAHILREYDDAPVLRFDVQRAKEECGSSVLNLPQRNLHTFISAWECLERLRAIKPGDNIALDIEGTVASGIRCISFATSPTEVFICGFGEMSPQEEAGVVKAIDEVCFNRKIGKILQNALYDQFVLAYRYGILIRNIVHDTMLSGWEIYPELEKSLEFQTSIWTREPFYKGDFNSTDRHTFYEYCCKDSAVTYEIALRHQKVFNARPKMKAHFEFNMRMLEPLMYMELRGINYRKELAQERHAQYSIIVDEVQSRLDKRVGQSVNPDAPAALASILYDKLKFPVQHPKKGNVYDKTKRTTNEDALLNIAKLTRDPFVFDVLSWRRNSGIVGDLEMELDPDLRARSTYNVVGASTGRLSNSKSPTGKGMNLQTVTYNLRDLFIPDPGKYMWQCDLAGADGWTVAAECKALGDSTMFDDYCYGLKPAKIIALLYKHGKQVNTWSRERIKKESEVITEKGEEGWLYFACKRVQHGTNYLLGVNTMSGQILKDSYKKMGTPINVAPKECALLQQLYLSRYYGVTYWQNKVKHEIVKNGCLECASGHVRRFFGRTSDHETYRKATAQNPQANTTFATNTAILRLWDDVENYWWHWRYAKPTDEMEEILCKEAFSHDYKELIVEPLHQIHDAALGQFDIPLAPWASKKIKQWFDNKITVAGTTFVIPYDGKYGMSWKDSDMQFKI